MSEDEQQGEEQQEEGKQINPLRNYGPTMWLQPFPTPHSNMVLKAPPGTEDEVNDLDVELAYEGRAIWSVSAWGLTDDQRRMIAAGAHLAMGVALHPIPPLQLSIEPPFCQEDGHIMVFVRSEGVFACPDCDLRFKAPDNGAVRLNEEDAGHAPEDDPDASRRALDEAHRDFSPESRDSAGEPDA